MSGGEEKGSVPSIVVQSTRFGELTVPADSVITMPSGLIGFSRGQKFIMLEHKPPFSWLQCVDDPNLAFVVVDGFEFGDDYKAPPPVGDLEIDLKEDDEYAILVVVTVRPNPKDTTANLKAPVFVNLRNKRGVQVIFDNPNLSTRFPLWNEEAAETKSGEASKEDSGSEKK